MKITVGTQTQTFQPNVTVAQALEKLAPDCHAVAARCFSRILELNDPLMESTVLQPIAMPEVEARRIVERSLHLVMLSAVHRLWPGIRVRIEHSAGRGVQVYLPGMTVDEEKAGQILSEMQRITAKDIPLEKKQMKVSEAIRLFEKTGFADKADLLRLRPAGMVTLYGCDGYWDCFYGSMLPSAAMVGVFAVYPSNGGFALMESDPEQPEKPSRPFNSPRHLAVFAESANWCEILGVQNAPDLSRLAESQQLRRFIRINEAMHMDSISAIAQEIIQRGKRIVLIAGPSNSGKTTFAKRLDIQLRVRGQHPLLISMDDYLLSREQIPVQTDATHDYVQPEALDLPLLRSHVRDLLRGEAVALPNRQTGRENGMTVLPDHEMLLIEGSHGLNPMLEEGLPAEEVHRVFVSALTCLNLDDHNRIRTTDVRLLRRIVHECCQGSTSLQETLRTWPMVTEGERRWSFPFQENADSLFNTTLHYELPFLKARCFSMLGAVPKGDPAYPAAQALFRLLGYIPAAAEELFDEIPPTSILREFVGGLTFDKD